MAQIFDEPIIEDKLPVFLKVLCILTFVGSGLALIGVIYSFAAGTDAQDTIDQLQKQQGNEMFAGMVKGMKSRIGEMNKWMKIQNYASLLNVILCFTGALMMWKKKKTGFYLYLIGQVVIVAVGFAYCVVVKDIPFLGITSIITQILTFIIYASFVIMYASNLKHMR